MRQLSILALLALGSAVASPALASDGRSGGHGAVHHGARVWHGGGWYGGWTGGWQNPTVIYPAQAEVDDTPPPQNRDEWLRECRRRLGDRGTGGAVIGGIVGGVAGHELAGRGDKVLGTVAGAAVGAIAGAAIDRAEDAPRVRDRCEGMLEGWNQNAAGQGYGYAYGVPVMLVPAPMVPGAAPAPTERGKCVETVVTEEFVERVPRRSRLIPPRARPLPDKRVRLIPDKRIAQ